MSEKKDNIHIQIRIYKEDHEKLSNRGVRGTILCDILHLALLELEQYEIAFDEKTKKIVRLEAKKRMDRWRKRSEK